MTVAIEASPRVSIILLTYNRANLLDLTIESLLHQSMNDFELLVADDASPDLTASIACKWAAADARVRYQRRPANVGRTVNMNLGIQESRGDYIAILHDDDVYAQNLLEEWAALLDRHPGAAFVFNAYRALDSYGGTRTIYRAPLPECFPGSLLIEGVFFRRWRFDSPVRGTVMLRRSAFNHVGDFDGRFKYWSDVDMWMRLAEKFDVCYADEPLIAYRDQVVAPHQFEDRPNHVQPILERMFWEARARHFRDRPLRRWAEELRHCAFACASRGWNFACTVKRSLQL